MYKNFILNTSAISVIHENEKNTYAQERLHYTWVLGWSGQSQKTILCTVVSIAHDINCGAWCRMLYLHKHVFTAAESISPQMVCTFATTVNISLQTAQKALCKQENTSYIMLLTAIGRLFCADLRWESLQHSNYCLDVFQDINNNSCKISGYQGDTL